MNRFAAWPGHAVLALPVRLYLAAVFGLACFHKILDPAAFALDVATYQILPVALVHPMALVLPWVEAATAVMLALGLRTRVASFLCAGMMGMFLVALAIALHRGLDMSCGCFAAAGAEADPISGATLLRDAVWLALAAYVFFFDRRPLGLDRLWPPAAPSPEAPAGSGPAPGIHLEARCPPPESETPRSAVKLLSWLPLLVLVAAPATAAARTPKCEALPEAQRAVAGALFERLHPYDCCDDTLAACLVATPRCPVVARLADDVCRMVAAGKDGKEIEAALGRRARSMLPLGAPAPIAVEAAATAGDPAAPVTVAIYACTRCPFCKIVVPALHREVTLGALKGKVRLAFRPFPIRDHAGSTEGGMALLAAARQEKFWPYLLDLYARYDAFDPRKLGERAAALGLSREPFDQAMADPALREALVEAKREGVRNKVTATPTVFIDGRRYHYDLDPEVLVDVLLEEHERVTGR